MKQTCTHLRSPSTLRTSARPAACTRSRIVCGAVDDIVMNLVLYPADQLTAGASLPSAVALPQIDQPGEFSRPSLIRPSPIFASPALLISTRSACRSPWRRTTGNAASAARSASAKRRVIATTTAIGYCIDVEWLASTRAAGIFAQRRVTRLQWAAAAGGVGDLRVDRGHRLPCASPEWKVEALVWRAGPRALHLLPPAARITGPILDQIIAGGCDCSWPPQPAPETFAYAKRHPHF